MKKIHKNIIITILFHTLGKTSTAIATKQGDELLNFLKEVLEFANMELEKDEIIYSDLTPKEAENNITNINNMKIALITVFNTLFNILTVSETKIIQPEYQRLNNNLDNIRNDTEISNLLIIFENQNKNITKFDKDMFTSIAQAHQIQTGNRKAQTLTELLDEN